MEKQFNIKRNVIMVETFCKETSWNAMSGCVVFYPREDVAWIVSISSKDRARVKKCLYQFPGVVVREWFYRENTFEYRYIYPAGHRIVNSSHVAEA